jgi:hypothetical protein
LRHKIRVVDVLNRTTSFSRRDCGALNAITNALGRVTLFDYDY